MILVDTSVWVGHLQRHDPDLARELESGTVLVHPFVVGELALGNLHNRRDIVRLLTRLPGAPVATHGEALAFIEHRGLAGRGIGYVDVHLLASAALGGDTRLWTKDRRLARVAAALGLGWSG